MKLSHLVTLTILGLFCTSGLTQPAGEFAEQSPEELDAAFSAEDAAREAASWSDAIIPRDNRPALSRITDESDLVFHGTVQSQTVVYDDKGIPFTHTTFSIRELVKGKLGTSEFTLVQEGGPDRTIPDKVLLVSTSSHFAVGEEELLFVKLDEATDSHIVQQRLRVLQDNVYNEDGYGVVVRDGPAHEGPQLSLTSQRNPDDRFTTVRIGPHTLFKNARGHSAEAGEDFTTGREASAASAEVVGSTVGDVIAAIAERGAPE